ANSVFADEILELMEKVDECKKKIVVAQENVAKGRAELDKAQQNVRDQHDSLQGDYTRLEGELKVVEQGLPDDVREPYYRIVKSKGSDAMAQVEGDNCGGCYQMLTPNQANSLRLDKVAFCQSCGRLMYLPEDRSIGSV